LVPEEDHVLFVGQILLEHVKHDDRRVSREQPGQWAVEVITPTVGDNFSL